MKALFIGHSYIDVTFLTDYMPTGDEKHVGQDYTVSFGGNALTAAYCCTELGARCTALMACADDWLGKMHQSMAMHHGLELIERRVEKSALSLVLPNNGKRAIVRCRDTNYTENFPQIDISECKAVHIDGHQPDAALHYLKQARRQGILTSLDGGTVREDTPDILPFIDVAVVSERFCEKLGKSPEDTLTYLLSHGVKVPAVTLGADGMIFVENSQKKHLKAIPIPPEKIVDTNGAGDIFHGAYIYSFLQNPRKSWKEHFTFARAASALSIQKMGNEASLPSLRSVHMLAEKYKD